MGITIEKLAGRPFGIRGGARHARPGDAWTFCATLLVQPDMSAVVVMLSGAGFTPSAYRAIARWCRARGIGPCRWVRYSDGAFRRNGEWTLSRSTSTTPETPADAGSFTHRVISEVTDERTGKSVRIILEASGARLDRIRAAEDALIQTARSFRN